MEEFGAEQGEDIEITLTTLPLAHVYKLPPRPDTRGWNCQQWPKENHIFSGRVVIVAKGSLCTIRLMDVEKGTLFAQCPLDNDNPHLSVEPALDSSRYFVLRVSDGAGRHAYLGMGFVERSDGEHIAPHTPARAATISCSPTLCFFLMKF